MARRSGGRDLRVGTAAGAGSAGTDDGGLSYMKAAACIDANAGGGELVPLAKLRE